MQPLTPRESINLIVASRALIFNQQQKLLLVSEDGSFWYLPGGYQESDETIIAAAERETYEETGIAVKALRTIAVSEYITTENFDPRFKYAHKVEHYILCQTTHSDLPAHWTDIDADFVQYRQFFSKEELLKQQYTVKPEFLMHIDWQQFINYPECYLEFENRLPKEVSILTELTLE